MVPNDPDNRMNELLRGYAQKRRAEVGPPFEMPPGTRRTLRAEVDRMVSARAGTVGDNDFSSLIWRRLLWGGAVTVVLFVAAGLWLHQEQEQELAISQQSQTNLAFFVQDTPVNRVAGAEKGGLPERLEEFELSAAKRAAETPAPPVAADKPAANAPANLTLAERDRALDRVQVAMATAPDAEVFSNAPRFQYGLPRSASAPAPAPVVGASVKGGQNALARKDQPSESFALSDRLPEVNALTETAAPARPLLAKAESRAKQATLNVIGAPNQNRTLRFQQVDLRSRYRANLNSPPPPKVLTTFDVQTVGSRQVRIVDADGSVYQGDLQLVPPAQQVASASLARRGTGLRVAKTAGMQAAPGPEPASVNETEDRSFAFRAIGTNVTLNQVVEFTGEFDPSPMPGAAPQEPEMVTNLAALQNTVSNEALKRPAAPANVQNAVSNGSVKEQQAASVTSNVQNLSQKLQAGQVNSIQGAGRILGRASIGGKNELKIEAQQIAP